MVNSNKTNERADLLALACGVRNDFERVATLLAEDARLFPDAAVLPGFARLEPSVDAQWLKARYRRVSLTYLAPPMSWVKKFDAMARQVENCGPHFRAVADSANKLAQALQSYGVDPKPLLELVRRWEKASANDAVLLLDRLVILLKNEATGHPRPLTPSNVDTSTWWTVRRAMDELNLQNRSGFIRQAKKWGIVSIGGGAAQLFDPGSVIKYREERSAVGRMARASEAAPVKASAGSLKPLITFECKKCGDTAPDEGGTCRKCGIYRAERFRGKSSEQR